MPRYLALDGDTNLLQLLSANVKGEAVRLEKSLGWEEDQPMTALNASAVGARLREQLKGAGIAPAPLLVCVGRDRVILKEMRIPSVPEHEEPALVRFQAMKEFTDGGEEVVLDYVPLGPAGPEGRRIQVMSVRKDVLKAYRILAEAAGLKLAALTPRPFALLAGLKQAIQDNLVPPPEPADAPVGLLVRGLKWGEFTIVRGGVLGLTRSVAGPALASDVALLGEIRRNLALYANQNPDHPVRALYLAEPDTPGGLRERLQGSLAIPVHAYEPVVGVPVPDGPPGALAGLAGLFAIKASREASINFAQPREPKPPRDPNKRLLALAAVAAVLFLGALGVFGYMRVSAKKVEVANLQRELNGKQDKLRAADPDIKRLKALDDWSATDINWLDELYDMSARIDAKDLRSNLRLRSITINSIENQGPASAKSGPKYTAQMVVTGMKSADPVPFDTFIAQFGKDKSYRQDGRSTKGNTAVERFLFAQEFTLKFAVEKRKPEQYTRTLRAEAPPRRKGADADEGDNGEKAAAGAKEEGQ